MRNIIREIVKEEIENLLSEFYHSNKAIGGYKFTKFINNLDKIKDGNSNSDLDELISSTFNFDNEDDYEDVHLLLLNYLEDNIGLREVSKELRNFGLLRGN